MAMSAASIATASAKRADPEVPWSCIDLVADLEVSYVGADLGDHPGEIVAECEGSLVLQELLELAVANHLVQRIDAGTGDPDEDVAVADRRLRDIGGPQAVLAVPLDNERLHVS